MREVRTGVWREALHPDWKPGEKWGPESRPTRSTTASSCSYSIRWLLPARSTSSRPGAKLALPVEVVLPTQGAPTDRAALERALS